MLFFFIFDNIRNILFIWAQQYLEVQKKLITLQVLLRTFQKNVWNYATKLYYDPPILKPEMRYLSHQRYKFRSAWQTSGFPTLPCSILVMEVTIPDIRFTELGYSMNLSRGHCCV